MIFEEFSSSQLNLLLFFKYQSAVLNYCIYHTLTTRWRFGGVFSTPTVLYFVYEYVKYSGAITYQVCRVAGTQGALSAFLAAILYWYYSTGIN